MTLARLRSITGILALSLLAACAFTRDEVAVNYTYKGGDLAPLTQSQINLVSDLKVDDRRSVDDPRLLINKRNAYGQTTGGYIAERAVADIVRSALADGFNRAGIRTDGGAGQPVLHCQLMNVGDRVQMGFWSGNYTMEIMLKAELIDPSSNRVLWNDTLIGRASKGDLVILGEEQLLEVFGKSLDDLVKQIVESNGLRSRLVTKG